VYLTHSTQAFRSLRARFARRSFSASILVVSATMLIGAIPTGATASTAAVTPVSVNVSDGQLSTIDLNALGLESSQLASALVKIPALSAVPGGTLTSILTGLPANATLQDLLTAIKTATGIEVTAGEAIQAILGDAATNPAVLSTLLSDLASLLNGTPQGTQLEAVLGNLISGLNPAQLEQLETQLGTVGTPAELASALVGKLAAGELTSALTTALGELGTTTTTTGPLAATAAAATPSALAGELGLTEEALTKATGTSTPLGPLRGFLDVLGTPSGLTLGTVPSTSSNTTNTTGSTTTNSSSTTTASSTPVLTGAGKASTPPGKVKIISRKLERHKLVLVVQVPGAGKLTVGAAHAKRRVIKATKTATMTVAVALTNAAIASISHKHKLTLQVKVAFKPTSGSASSATTTVHYR
jgi:hypothetical protein